MLIRDITDLTKAYVVVRDLDSVRSSYIHKNYTQPFKPNGSISNFKSDKPRVVEDTAKPPERADKSKSSSTTKCFWCQGYGHIAYACPSPFKIFMINGDPVPAPDSDTEGFTFYLESDGEDFDFEDDTLQDDIYLNCVRTSTRLSVVRCAYYEPKEKDEWRRTTILHTH